MTDRAVAESVGVVEHPSTPARPRRYRIVIGGRISDRLGAAFPEMAMERCDGRTVLLGSVGRVPLDDLLDRLGDLGLEPLSVDVEE